MQNQDAPNNSQPNTLIIIDTRLAVDPIRSGIAHFIVGFARALTLELHKLWSPLQILLVGKHQPADWILELVKTYPNHVRFWSGGPGALTSDFEKPVYSWSSRTLRALLNLFPNQTSFYWLAPGNFDRPLTLFLNKPRAEMYEHICQIIHDTIPYDVPESHGFLFRNQFKFFTKRALTRLKHVYTVSEHSAHRLAQVAPKRTLPIVTLPCGIDEVFGSKKALPDTQKQPQKIQFLKTLAEGQLSDELIQKISQMRWVVGVGREQSYKRWPLAQQAVLSAQQRFNKPILFFRVGCQFDSSSTTTKNYLPKFGKIQFRAETNFLGCEYLDDSGLTMLYRVSDVMLHPSLAEGFGLPPAEAALCGLPVIFTSGTAIDDHFKGLPENYWRGVHSTEVAAWADVLLQVLADKHENEFFKKLYNAPTSRNYVLGFANRSFNWGDTANLFLQSIEQQ